MMPAGRIAAARAGVAHRPAKLEHRLAVEFGTGEATAPDERPVRSVTRHPFADPVRRPPGRHVRCPCLHRRTGPGAGPIRDDRIAAQQVAGSLTSSEPTGVMASRGVSTGSVAAWAGRLAGISSVNSLATPPRRLTSPEAHVLTPLAGGASSSRHAGASSASGPLAVPWGAYPSLRLPGLTFGTPRAKPCHQGAGETSIAPSPSRHPAGVRSAVTAVWITGPG
jgi:hypothetical protein